MKLNKIIIVLILLNTVSLRAMYEEYGYEWAEEPESPVTSESEEERPYKFKYIAPETDEAGRYPIHVAALYGEKEKVKQLLENETNLDITDPVKNTPLMYAISGVTQNLANLNNYIEIITMLVEAGADQSLRNDEGKTALDMAEESNNEAVINALKGHKTKL